MEHTRWEIINNSEFYQEVEKNLQSVVFLYEVYSTEFLSSSKILKKLLKYQINTAKRKYSQIKLSLVSQY
jgi:hypothetical protein